MAIERTQDNGEGGMNMAERHTGQGEVQIIGDRMVINSRTRLGYLRDAQGIVIEAVRLSLEVCGCGYSFARAGVGYSGQAGWYCKRCGQLHTLDEANAEGATVDPANLKPDPARVRQFDLGNRVSADWSTPEDLEVAQ